MPKINTDTFDIKNVTISDDGEFQYNKRPLMMKVEFKKIVWSGEDKFNKKKTNHIIAISKTDHDIIKQLEEFAECDKSYLSTRVNGNCTNYSMSLKADKKLEEGKYLMKFTEYNFMPKDSKKSINGLRYMLVD